MKKLLRKIVLIWMFPQWTHRLCERLNGNTRRIEEFFQDNHDRLAHCETSILILADRIQWLEGRPLPTLAEIQAQEERRASISENVTGFVARARGTKPEVKA